jgi:enoyl-CoA hydratase
VIKQPGTDTGGRRQPGVDELVHYQVQRAVAVITLDSPHNRNALSRRLVAELTAHLSSAGADEGVRAVLLTARGTAFCSGMDLAEAEVEPMEQTARGLVGLLRRLVELPKPVVVKLAGPVRAGGTGIVAAADIALTSTDVSFAFTEVRVGVAPAVISIPLLPRLLPRAAARYLMTGETFDAAEAARIGLVTQAVPPDRLDGAVDGLLEALRHAAPQAVRETKELLTRRLLGNFDELGEPMAALSARLFGSPEAQEGRRAFFEKRPPQWSG